MKDQDYEGEESRRPINPAALRHLSMQDFARLGAEDTAYMRPVVLNGAVAISIHSADGTQIGAAPSYALAAAAIRQHEMEPALVN